MNAYHSNTRIKFAHAFVLRRVILVIASIMLAGCQWLPQAQTDHWYWPWQEQGLSHTAGSLAQQQTINNLIAKGNLAFVKDRLSVPANDNAVMYYQAALKLDPGNTEAEEGLVSVGKRYRKLARTAHDNGNGKQAYKYLELAESISGKDAPANRKLRRQLQATPEGQNQRALDRSLQEEYKTQKKMLEEKQRALPTSE